MNSHIDDALIIIIRAKNLITANKVRSYNIFRIFLLVEPTPRFNLGAHKSFMESSKALIQNTNSRLEKMNLMSKELRQLTSEIQPSEHTVLKLGSKVKKNDEEHTNGDTNNSRPSINIVIPTESSEGLSEDEEVKLVNTSRKKRPSNKQKKKQYEKVKTLLQKCAKSSDKETGDKESTCAKNITPRNRQSTTPSSPNSPPKHKGIDPYAKFAHSGIKASDKAHCLHNVETSYASHRKQCCLFHKYGFCDVEKLKMHFSENRMKWVKMNSKDKVVTKEQVATAVVRLSLPSPAKTVKTGNDYSRHLSSSSIRPLSWLQNTDIWVDKGSRNNYIHRKVLLPKKINLDSQYICAGANKKPCKQIDPFLVSCRFRLDSSSKYKSSVY